VARGALAAVSSKRSASWVAPSAIAALFRATSIMVDASCTPRCVLELALSSTFRQHSMLLLVGAAVLISSPGGALLETCDQGVAHQT